MAPFAERDGDIANAWMEGLGNVVVPREPLLPLSHSVNSKLTTLCPRLDAWLRGGVPTRSVTEIAGEAGSAKTQLALQLLIAAQLPREMGGLDGTAVYVHTEGRAPLSRLKQLVASHPAVCKYTEAKKKTKTDSEIDLMNGVYVAETLDDPDGLWTALVSVASVLSETNDDGVKKRNPCVYWWWIRCRARFASRTRRARAERFPARASWDASPRCFASTRTGTTSRWWSRTTSWTRSEAKEAKTITLSITLI